MKTLLLGLFAAFIMLSATVSNALEEDYWVKTDFPDTRVSLIFRDGVSDYVYSVYAVSADNEIYLLNGLSWEKLDIIIDQPISSMGGYGLFEFLIGTDRGLYAVDEFDYTVEKLAYFNNMKIVAIASDMFDTYVMTDRDFYYYSDLYMEWIECNLPEGNKALKSIAISDYEVMGLTNSGEIYISADNCETWTKAAENPSGHSFTAIEKGKLSDSYVVGSDQGVFTLDSKGELTEVEGYDGGYVSCISFWEYFPAVENVSKKNKTLFIPFQFESDVVVGTALNGVYGISRDNNTINQKNDSLVDLSITSICYSESGIVFAGTKNSGIYRTHQIPKSVEELDLASYALKISPNPAKSRVSISFHNPEYAEIEISIYDLFGRKVADVHSGNLAEGDYNFSADLSRLASGSYFLRFGVAGRVGSVSLIVD